MNHTLPLGIIQNNVVIYSFTQLQHQTCIFYEVKPFFWNEWMQIKIVEFISIKKSTNPFSPMNSNRNQNRNGFVQCAWQNNRGFLLKDKEQHVANRKTWGPLVFIFCCLICLSKDTLLYILVNLKKVAGACFTKKPYITPGRGLF